MEREVIVVGAGPAGSAAAMSLSQQGHDVLLLDRQTFPRDKACGDGIPAGVIEFLWEMGMKEKLAQADFYPIEKLRLVSPKGYVFEDKLTPGRQGASAHVVPRLQFDALLQQHAVDSGAEFCRAQVTEPIVEHGRVRGVRARVNGMVEDIRAKIVVAADGVTSTIARAIRPDKHQDLHRAVALRAYIDDIEVVPHTVEFYLLKDILPGYAWIFPMGSHCANIGLGMRLDKFRQKKHKLEALLTVFMSLPLIKKRLLGPGTLRDMAIWQLNFGSQKNVQRVFDGAVLVGDAGGFIDPLTGGGIYSGILSARLAAETIHQALVEGNFSRQKLQQYEQRCREIIWPGMRRSYFIQRTVMVFPSLSDWLIKRASNNSQLVKTFTQKL